MLEVLVNILNSLLYPFDYRADVGLNLILKASSEKYYKLIAKITA
jgi:hypothetical protein